MGSSCEEYGVLIMNYLIIISILLCLISEAKAATTYYLKPDTGLDANNGCCPTQGAGANGPWKTFFKVKTTVVAGDTINIVGGTYTNTQYKGEGSLPLWTNSHSRGTPGNPITIQANPGDTVILDGEYNVSVYWQLFRATVAGNQDFYIKIQNIIFQHFYGAAIGIGINAIPGNITRKILVQGCTFKDFIMNSSGTMGTHLSDQIIFKNNTIYNIGNPVLGAGDGNPDSQHAFYISHDSSNIVAEGNYMEKVSGFGFHGFLGFQGGPVSNWIIRRNTMVNMWYSGITTQGGTINNTYVYHNTIYSEAVPFSEIASTTAKAGMNHHGSASVGNANYRNNIVVGAYNNGISGAVWSDDNTRFGGSLKMNFNLWLNTVLPAQTVYWSGSGYTMANWKTSGFGYDANSINVSPNFANPGAAYPNRNFTLGAGSPAVDAGAVLTTTVGTGTGSTTITVADAGFFHDGFGIGVGDVIRVGSNTVTITSVNYSANVLTVTPAISWTNGQGVSLPYNGTAPDMGAFESASTPTGPTNLGFIAQPQSTTPGTTLTPIVVEVRTATGARDTTSTALVTLALSGGPGFFPSTSVLQTQTFSTPKTGRYVQLVTLADANGSNSASAAEITVLNAGTPISQAGMSVVSVSSQETSSCCGGPHLATTALDGNTSTYWYTQYTGGKLGPPYTLVLDLGASYSVNGWRYLSHQLPDPDGHVTQYRFSVSTDGSTWGTPLTDAGLTGTLTRNAVAGVATFNDLRLTTLATGYQFAATAPSLNPANSTNFNIAAPPPPTGIVYYVSAGGHGEISVSDSNSCNTAQDILRPKRNIVNAINNCAAPGVTIVIRSGTYTEALGNVAPPNLNWPVGSSWNEGGYFKLQGYTGDSSRPVLRPISASYPVFDFHRVNAINGQFPKYIWIDNVEVDRGKTGDDHTAVEEVALYFTINHLKVTNSKFGNGNTILISGGGDDNDPANSGNDFTFQFNEVHHAYVGLDTGIWSQAGCGCPPPGCACSVGEYCMYISPNNSLIADNIIHDCTAYAMHFYHGGNQSLINNNIIRNNTIYNCATSDGHRNISVGIIVDSGHDNTYYNNVLYNNGFGSVDAVANIQFRGNNLSAYNNTIVNTSAHGIFLDQGSGHDARNNIVYQSVKAPILNNSGGLVRTNLTGTNPQFSDSDFRLSPGSPAATSGEDLSGIFGLDKDNLPRTAPWSMGAYEQGSTITIPPDITTGLVLYYKMNDLGTSLTDETANHNNATLFNGVAHGTGKYGGATSFTGASQYGQIPPSASLNNLSALTMSAWVYTRTIPTTYSRIMDKGGSDFSGWHINYFAGENRLGFFLAHSGQEVSAYSSINSIIPNTWQHVIVSWDGTANASGITFAVDCSVKGLSVTRNASGIRINDSANNIILANRAPLDAGSDVMLDEVRIYNRALNSSDRNALCAFVPTPSATTLGQLLFFGGN